MADIIRHIPLARPEPIGPAVYAIPKGLNFPFILHIDMKMLIEFLIYCNDRWQFLKQFVGVAQN